jgi:hypothetical protein
MRYRTITDPLQAHYRACALQARYRTTTGPLRACSVQVLRHGEYSCSRPKYGLRQRITGMGAETRWRMGILAYMRYVGLQGT